MLTCIGIFAHVKYILSLVLNFLSFFKSLFKELISYFELSPKGSSHIWISLKVCLQEKGLPFQLLGVFASRGTSSQVALFHVKALCQRHFSSGYDSIFLADQIVDFLMKNFLQKFWLVGETLRVIHLIRAHYFIENEHFLPRDTRTQVCVLGVRNVGFSETFAYVLTG